VDAVGTSICLILRAIILSARSAGEHRRVCREEAANLADDARSLGLYRVTQRSLLTQGGLMW
jgi:hypothetical protein